MEDISLHILDIVENSVTAGASLLRQAAETANGSFSIESKKGEGTSVRAIFQYSHIDRQPLGDMEETIKTLVIGNPHVDFHYEHDLNGRVSIFDTRKVREELSGVLLSSPQGIKIIKKYLKRSTSNLSEAKSK
jgi:hypothetical protein